MESKIQRAEVLLREWIAEEKVIDKERAEIIRMLQKKIYQIQEHREITRRKITESIKLFEQFKLKNNATES